MPQPLSQHQSLTISTTNCRGLCKTADPTVRHSFIRYLRSHSFDLIALQETHASTPDIQDIFHSQFQASSSLCTCGRIITATVSHITDCFLPITVTVLYASAARQDRMAFLRDLADNPSPFFSLNPTNHVVLGDWNYSYGDLSRSAPDSWLQFVSQHFVDCLTPIGSTHQHTFHRGLSSSCLDYIFASPDLVRYKRSLSVVYIQPSWTDHCLLQANFQLPLNLDSPVTGPGLWRVHPGLSKDELFCDILLFDLKHLIDHFPHGMTVQSKWEEIKRITKDTALHYSRRKTFDLKQGEALLQRKRGGITRKIATNPQDAPQLLPQLNIVEHQLASLQQYRVDTLALRAGIRWRECGELSAGYLKRTVKQKSRRKNIECLRHPVSSSLCVTNDDMLDAAASFYGSLYSPELIDQSASSLLRPFSLSGLLVAVRRCPHQSSPGSDGLPYALLSVILQIPECQSIAVEVFNDALSLEIFPPSWFDTCLSLLPKKGDLSDLRNWRPISLINTDAKVFTRLLNGRLLPTVSSLITPFQTGFMRGRFIADNGLFMKLVMDHCSNIDSSAVGLLLDQEKAYDRVHPDYLRQVLKRIGIPDSFVDSICRLFFGTCVRVNVNGFLSGSVPQLRGLLQGDPLSPVLFNLAFEPFLRSVLHDSLFNGVSLPISTPAPVPLPSEMPAVKLLAYADDVFCLLNAPSDLDRLIQHYTVYLRASNASLNYSKTQVLSLSGSSSIYSTTWRSQLQSYDIHTWHDRTAPDPITYLGFPLSSSITQRDSFLDKIHTNIATACKIHSQRSLSVRGLATIVNSLILSKLWYALRVIWVPVAFLDKIKSTVSRFLTTGIFPRLSFATMCLPRVLGGLGILDPAVQQRALQMRWLVPLLQPSHPPSDAVRALFADVTSDTYWDYRLPFLFPDLRRPVLRASRVLSLLFATVDALPRNWSHVVINSITVLALPVMALTLSPDPSLVIPKSFSKLRGDNIFIIDLTSLITRARQPTELPSFPRFCKKFLKMVSGSQLSLASFFLRTFLISASASQANPAFDPVSHDRIDVSPFVDALFGLSPSSVHITDHPLSPRCALDSSFYRSLLRSNSPAVTISWKNFWSYPLSHHGRNIWYRLLHGKIPCRELMYKIVPLPFPDGACILCGQSELTHALFYLNLPARKLLWMPAPSVILGAALVTLWKAHWRLVFDNVPFCLAPTLIAAEKLIAHFANEQVSGQVYSAFAIPHIHWILIIAARTTYQYFNPVDMPPQPMLPAAEYGNMAPASKGFKGLYRNMKPSKGLMEALLTHKQYSHHKERSQSDEDAVKEKPIAEDLVNRMENDIHTYPL
ncbi:hypothetical protein G6F64_008697 [Rhizopus arrhizus]|uniref:Reverse transcriptase domain-containing protein n=1 Tax=Rhizopus oryzae TaxID=64495 RepID=A0A9P6X4T5_RHIOR|nr:hypothetical protein G6F64_008697 [Rhizopus arrhizus]